MDAYHPNLFHGVSRAELDSAVAALAAVVPELSDDELLVGVLRIVAMVSADGCDGHLGAFVWGTGSYPVESLPLRLWWFDEGVQVVDALAPYRDLVGARIEAINGHPIAEVLSTLDPIVPRDNEMTVRLLMPRFLLMPQILRGLGLAAPDGPSSLDIVDGDGTAREVAIEPIAMSDYNAWAGSYGLHLPIDPGVLYLSRIGDDLWWQVLDGDTLFVQYNAVNFESPQTLDDLRAVASDPSIERVVVDVRHNFGGEVPAVDPIVDVFRDPAIDRAGRLFVVTGRNTLSAGSLFTARTDEFTAASIVGEAMGGCPTFYGDIELLTLPYSGISVSVPTLPEIGVSATDDRLTIEPDLPARLTPEAWAAGEDPALAAIQATQP